MLMRMLSICCWLAAWNQPSVNESDLGYPWDKMRIQNRIQNAWMWFRVSAPAPRLSSGTLNRIPNSQIWKCFRLQSSTQTAIGRFFQNLPARRAIQKCKRSNFNKQHAWGLYKNCKRSIKMFTLTRPYKNSKQLIFKMFPPAGANKKCERSIFKKTEKAGRRALQKGHTLIFQICCRPRGPR